MMQEHSQAPWTGTSEITAADGTPICQIYAIPSDRQKKPGMGEADANAWLIRAAPKMLAALKAIAFDADNAMAIDDKAYGQVLTAIWDAEDGGPGASREGTRS